MYPLINTNSCVGSKFDNTKKAPETGTYSIQSPYGTVNQELNHLHQLKPNSVQTSPMNSVPVDQSDLAPEPWIDKVYQESIFFFYFINPHLIFSHFSNIICSTFISISIRNSIGHLIYNFSLNLWSVSFQQIFPMVFPPQNFTF